MDIPIFDNTRIRIVDILNAIYASTYSPSTAYEGPADDCTAMLFHAAEHFRPPMTPQHVAALIGTYGADVSAVNADGNTPLHVAASNGGSGGAAVASVLLAFGADTEAKTLKHGKTALHLALFFSDAEITTLLLRCGADTEAKDKDGETPLFAACEAFSETDVPSLFLVEGGADVSAKDVNGATPLHRAASNENTEMVSLLLRWGADVDASENDESTPLHIASSGGNTDVIALLLRQGADVTALDDGWWTPLHMAASNGHVDAVAMLLEFGAGADFRAKSDGLTALGVADVQGYMEVSQLLQNWESGRA